MVTGTYSGTMFKVSTTKGQSYGSSLSSMVTSKLWRWRCLSGENKRMWLIRVAAGAPKNTWKKCATTAKAWLIPVSLMLVPWVWWEPTKSTKKKKPVWCLMTLSTTWMKRDRLNTCRVVPPWRTSVCQTWCACYGLKLTFIFITWYMIQFRL